MEQDLTDSAYLPQKLCLEICLSILEEALEQLCILRKINKWPETPAINVSYKTIDERFSTILEEATDEQSINREQMNLLAFQKNFGYIEAAFKTTYEELLTQESFESLLNIINVFKISKSDEENLKSDTVRKQSEINELYCALYEEKGYYHRKIEECMVDIGKIKDEIENFTDESDIKAKYIKEWENAKLEGIEILLQRKEQDTTNRIKKTEADISKEMRIHQEISNLLREMQRDLERDMDFWTEKYNKDIRELENKISILKGGQEKQRVETRNLKDQYLKRQKQMDEFKQYKIEQEQKKIELERVNKAATKIQAWWRGTMVIKGFGKFRKKKDKKPKKKSSEKDKD